MSNERKMVTQEVESDIEVSGKTLDEFIEQLTTWRNEYSGEDMWKRFIAG